MLDLKFIRDNIELVRENTRLRKVDIDIDEIVRLYDERNSILSELESLRGRRNDNARRMKERPTEEERSKLIEEGKALKQKIPELEHRLAETERNVYELASMVPNLTHPDAPHGDDDTANREIKRVGEPVRLDFPPKDHVELANALDLIDFETAADVSGTKFYYLRNQAVLLELALSRYAVDVVTRHGFTPTVTPDIAREEVASGIGFQPRGEESNIYTLEGGEGCLIGTAEITLGAYYRNRILSADDLPIKLAGLSHCFRREAGASGQFSKGLYRVHQFTKVEMFVYVRPEESDAMLEELLAIEEEIAQGLDFPYRVVDTCTGDLGGPAYRKYDIEAWMPGRGESGDWGEITSTSNCTDYQARRLATRYRENNGKPRLVHMLNGTAIANSRALVAILENGQQSDGSVRIPEVLVPYCGFDTIPAPDREQVK